MVVVLVCDPHLLQINVIHAGSGRQYGSVVSGVDRRSTSRGCVYHDVAVVVRELQVKGKSGDGLGFR